MVVKQFLKTFSFFLPSVVVSTANKLGDLYWYYRLCSVSVYKENLNFAQTSTNYKG